MSAAFRKLASAIRLIREDGWRQLAIRARENYRYWRLSRAGQGPMFYRSSLGCRFVTSQSDADLRSAYLHQEDNRAECAIIRAWLGPGDSVVDCGASVGLLAAVMADRVGRTGHVLAVEASPATFEKLRRVLSLLDLRQVIPVMTCVADRDGEVGFDVGRTDSVFHAMASRDTPAASQTTVPCARLDSLIERSELAAPALIKMDIEGAEPLALRGALKCLSPNHLPLLILEVFPVGLARQGLGANDILDLLPRDGYEFWHVNCSYPNPAPEFPRGRLLPLLDAFHHPWPPHSNLIAVPRQGAFAARRAKLSSVLVG